MTRLFICFICLVFVTCQSPDSKQNIKISDNAKNHITIGERSSLFSSSLNEDRPIFLSLPTNYERNTHSYPVIIVLDAEYLFNITTSIVNIKASRNEMPESIVVGIPNTKGKRYDMAMELRYEDGSTFFGNADGKAMPSYLTFLKDELLPYLKENYRVNNHETIIGMSPTFGPVLEAFWNSPNTFDAYIVLASELAVKTSSGATVKERVLKAIQDKQRTKSAIYIGKASDDLKRRPEDETLAYTELNQELKHTANPNINYKIEILKKENHYGMSISGIEHGLETIYPFEKWNIPYRNFWNSEQPAVEIKTFYDELSKAYGFEILPLEDAFYASQTLSGTLRRLERQGRKKELKDVLHLAMAYYPNSPELKKYVSKQ
ncbi:alpha/beta hydrolase [Winogradskyella sp.]|uniref:alpha/beta hydrolase n=1 Tax=Winogradskyella sp. TaxID=1883156 RepID=UPI003BADBB9E